MAHPLDGAFLRLTRADMHLTEANNLRRAWEKGCAEKVVRDYDEQQRPFYRFNGFPDIPPLFPVVVGEIVHNLRSALDYLVYELSVLDSKGTIKDGTQFPIEDCRIYPTRRDRGFDARRKTYLKGLCINHADTIESLQPYNGVEWTETLRDISNPDKHRHLCVLTKEGRQVNLAISWHPEGRFDVIDDDVNAIGVTERHFDLEVDGHYTIAILLPKRGEVPILPTLRRLQAEVAGTLELFKPEF